MDMQAPLLDELIQGDKEIHANFGIEVLGVHEGACELAMVVSSAWVNAAGFTHGSVAYALMDSACAYACASLDVLGLTTSGNVTYVRGSAEGARIRATAQVASQSRRVMTFTTQVIDQEDQLLAHGSFVFKLVEKR
jgi:acyl-CoA thioesterase|tara:strand:- start:673 stop:1080 length:408 start_codon:yes stop_codon:yes gene_type:complete